MSAKNPFALLGGDDSDAEDGGDAPVVTTKSSSEGGGKKKKEPKSGGLDRSHRVPIFAPRAPFGSANQIQGLPCRARLPLFPPPPPRQGAQIAVGASRCCLRSITMRAPSARLPRDLGLRSPPQCGAATGSSSRCQARVY